MKDPHADAKRRPLGRVRLIETVCSPDRDCGGDIRRGESGRRQITFSEQKLQVDRNSFH